MSGVVARVDAYLSEAPRHASDVVDVGAFTCFFRRESDHPMLSYARPRPSLGRRIGRDLRLVAGAFAAAGRRLRHEWVDECAPALAPALERDGLVLEAFPLLVLGRPAAVPAPAGVVVRPVTIDDDLSAVASVAPAVFDGGHHVDAGRVDALRESLAGPARLYAAFVDAAPVAVGAHVPIDGVTELAGIATLEPHRGRGIGTALTAALAADALDEGCSVVFLTAEPGAVGVYRRVGFLPVATGRAAMAPVLSP